MRRIDEIADVVEFRTWARNQPTTVSALKEELEAALSGEEFLDAESVAQNVMDEFVSRQILLELAYPFFCDGYKLQLIHKTPTQTTYMFCLALSLLPASEIENDQRSCQFETVVMNAAKAFFGGSAIRIGAPWQSAEIPTYGALLDSVISLIPNLGQKLKETAPSGGDAGWDVLIVKNFRDNMYPRFIALGNCATGRRDWKRKGMETQPTLFWNYFAHPNLSVLITFFAVPFLMDEDSRLRKLSSCSLTLDRFRICEYAPTCTGLAEQWLDRQQANALEVAIA